MGHWKDVFWEVTKSINEKGLRKEFDAQLEKMSYQNKHRYKETRDKWQYAHDKVIKENSNGRNNK